MLCKHPLGSWEGSALIGVGRKDSLMVKAESWGLWPALSLSHVAVGRATALSI